MGATLQPVSGSRAAKTARARRNTLAIDRANDRLRHAAGNKKGPMFPSAP
jgi:hypothetical protein